ncbi:MAG: hypothetical protein AB8I08_24070 [Sandaracinaceae bacterium]
MSDQAGDHPVAQLRAAVEGWSACAVRRRRRDALRRSVLSLVSVGSLAAAARSVVWPATEPHLVTGVSRAAALGLGAAALASLLVSIGIRLRVRGQPRRAARAMDRRLEDTLVAPSPFGAVSERGAHVVSNGWALIGVEGGGAALAVRRAARAAEQAGMPEWPRRRVSWARALLAAGIALAGLTLGTLDEHVLRVLMSPPSAEELAAADAMAEAARADTEADIETADRARGLARQAAAAVRRGDRDAALETLSRMQREMRAQAARRGDRERDLRAIARTFGALATRRPTNTRRGPAPGRAATEASDRADALARLLQARDDSMPSSPDARAARRRLLERLQRARTEASRQAARSPEDEHAQVLSRHLEDAADHLTEGDRQAASEAMAEAARALERRETALSQAVAGAQRDAPVHRLAEAVARALQRTRTGHAGQSADDAETAPGAVPPDDDGPRALSSAIASRLAALGLAEGSAAAGGGRHSRPRRGEARRGPEVESRSRARSQVTGRGGPAVAAISGMGARGNATTAYRDVFPDYGVQVEEALAVEDIPAPRRAVVRRYFESIRPSAPPQESP